MASNATPEELGRRAGERFYELTRRRLSSQAQGSRRDLARYFAGRGGGAGSSAAYAAKQLQTGERQALADASLQSILSGEQVGRQIASFQEGQRQFNEQIRQQMLNRQFESDQARARFNEQLQLLKYAEQLRKQQSKGGLFGKIFKGLGAGAITLLSGGSALPALAAGLGGGLGLPTPSYAGNSGGGTDYSNYYPGH